jgi:ABC-type transport system involved in Fe-S cluster assembly fused permease/ATPase subunit
MSLMAFNHLLNLSMSYHTRRKTGEVLRVLDRGSAINCEFALIDAIRYPRASAFFQMLWVYRTDVVLH